MPSLPSATGVKVISYSQLITQGTSNHYPFCPPKPEDVATICYTSGTTGTPKAWVLKWLWPSASSRVKDGTTFSTIRDIAYNNLFTSYLTFDHGGK
ncbi:putative long-chain-fatty-acid--CoA ligase [Helianthus annuus]|nr:putative long-chain-fatty-acid--CoA ligase [Helianthus annuus]